MKALDREEKQILSAFESGKLKSTVASEASLRRDREYARATLSKNKRVNIRLSTPDLSEIQARVLFLAYQSVSGRLVLFIVSSGTPRSPV